VVARSLGGELLSEFRYETHGATSLAGDTLTAMAAQQVAQHVAELPAEHGPLRSIGIAVPHVVPNQPTPASMIRLGARGEAQLQELLSALAVPGDVPVVLENNVNCAALAEMTLGAAREWTDFVYLQIGVGIGAGIISDGRLHRGASGAAGEIAAIPFPWQPADPSGAQPGNLEEYLGSAGLMHRYWDSIDSERDPRASTVREVFERAQQGDPVARRSADVHASDVAALVRTLVAVLDPAQILLGGGVGQNQLFVSAVATALARDLPQIAVEVGELGVRATAEGATRLATEFAYSELLGARYQPILVNQNSVRAG
jgi:predicted NBD/HSP70 family sugar kinase